MTSRNLKHSSSLALLADSASQEIRLDQFLARSVPRISRGRFQKAIKTGTVTINGIVCANPRRILRVGDEIRVDIEVFDEPKISPPLPEHIPLDIIFEDEDMLALNKAPEMIVHPADGAPDGTVVNALLGYFGESVKFAESFEDLTRPGIVHRLDKDTSGCLVIAKNQTALDALKLSFKNREVSKTYLAVLAGNLTGKGVLRDYIGRHPVNRKKMALLNEGGKLAVSHYEVMSTGDSNGVPVSLARIDIETGRTHQIRVQMAAAGHPVVGDAVYGGARANALGAARQLLHAHRIVLKHPRSLRTMLLEAPLPKDFQVFLDKCGLTINKKE